jgi:hypothetical protein
LRFRPRIAQGGFKAKAIHKVIQAVG